MLQCVALYCSVLQYDAMCCSVRRIRVAVSSLLTPLSLIVGALSDVLLAQAASAATPRYERETERKRE